MIFAFFTNMPVMAYAATNHVAHEQHNKDMTAHRAMSEKPCHDNMEAMDHSTPQINQGLEQSHDCEGLCLCLNALFQSNAVIEDVHISFSTYEHFLNLRDNAALISHIIVIPHEPPKV
jgi:hypothetical protein